MASRPQSDQPDDTRNSSSESSRPGNGKRRSSSTVIVRYGVMNWIGEFACRADRLPSQGTPVVVQTDRGIELGEQVSLCNDVDPGAVPPETLRYYVKSSGPEFCRPNAGRILRVANSQDLSEHEHLNVNVNEDIEQCALLAVRFNLDMKIITAEHLLGGERIVFYFRSDSRIDFRDLVKELAQRYHTRIEMRQVGARDEARLVADWEVCGRQCCCKNFLKKLRPVNMKMAKLQKSTLDPSKVSGRCGRLRCCLRYEHEGYMDLLAKLPRRGTRVRTPSGEATVEDYQILTQLIRVQSDNQQKYIVPLEEITEFDLPKPKPAPPPTVSPPPPVQPTPPKSKPADEPKAEQPAPKTRRRRRRRKSATPAAQSESGGTTATPPQPAPAAPTDSTPTSGKQTDGKTPAADSKPARKRRGRRRRHKKPSANTPPKPESS